MNEGLVLGIDLGTTFSSMAIVDRHGKPVIVTNAEGQPATPSVIHFYDQDACVVGDEAVKMVVVDPINVARFVKRSMGEPGFALEFFGRTYTPQELSAIILRKLREDAEEALGTQIRDAVVTVPAYFDSARRAATAEAGAIAGLNVLSIINEPTAAAISYGIDRLGGARRIMVFDLGGGTFDVTIMEIRGVSFRTIASDGNAELGGKDWDDRLLNHAADRFVEAHGADPRDDPQPYQELYERCLAAKISLSTKPKAVIPVNFRGNRLLVTVTRPEFEAMTRDLLDQCADTVQIVLSRAAMGWDDLDELILVGGSTRMPMVGERLRAISGREEASGVHPEECVALGAALAGVLRHRPDHPAIRVHRQELARRALATRGDASRPPTARAEAPESAGSAPGLVAARIVDATTHPLGVVVLDRDHNERVIHLIPAGSSVPCEKRGRFAYAYDNMTAVRVEVTEGPGENRDDVRIIGEVILDDLPPRPRGTPIDVVYRYGVNQILEIYIVDVETARARRARIEMKGGMDAHSMAQARRNVARARVK